MIIAVASTNPAKVKAVEEAVKAWENVRILPGEVKSGVSEQPFSDEETKRGAVNRASAVLKANPEAELGIGLEGGITEIDGELWNTVWCCVTDKKENTFCTNGLRFKLPSSIAKELRAGKELGPIMDNLAKQENTKKKQGMIGVVTENFMTRPDAYAPIVKLAIGLWSGRNWEKNLK